MVAERYKATVHARPSAGASEREELVAMSVPNIGPELPDPSDPDDVPRGGNSAPLYRDDTGTDEVHAASTRASTTTHRFGGVRYALSRREAEPRPPRAEGGESDESD